MVTTMNSYTPEQQNKLVEENIKLVYFFAQKICKRPEMLDDCIQEGCLGLIRAAKYFDESRGVKFSTFAGFEIKCAIRSYLYRDRLIQIPSTYISEINRFVRQISQMQSAENRELTEFEVFTLGHNLGLSDSIIQQVASPIISLNNTFVDGEGTECEHINYIVDDSESVEKTVETSEILYMVDDFMACIKSRNPKYVAVFRDYLSEILEAAIANDNPAESLISIVRKYHPEFIPLDEDDEATRKYKAKRLDSYYQSIREFWTRNLSKLQNELVDAGYGIL